MADVTNPTNFVITDADEGVQINAGVRFGFAGAGFQLDGFFEAVRALQALLPSQLRIVSSSESDWIKQKLNLQKWEEVDAMAQQHIQALADQTDLLYAGFMPFADPEEVAHGIKGHMVRPHDVHLANKICFTIGGGEQKYNLGQYLISADWISQVNKKIAKKILQEQISFYQKLAGKDLQFVYQTGGVLGKELAQANLASLMELQIDLAIKNLAKN